MDGEVGVGGGGVILLLLGHRFLVHFCLVHGSQLCPFVDAR